MSDENIFSALAKYNSAIDENYLTEAFVFLINSLLVRDRLVGLEILTKLCVNNNEFSFDIGEDVSVSTQETTEQGTPDIKVSSPNKLIYIEVKHDSPLGNHQLERYKKALESSTKTIKHVVLLTRFAIDYKGKEERPYKHVLWYEVYNWLEKSEAQDPVSAYLIESFNSFLEVKQMSIQKVGWEYYNGMHAFNNLIKMIGAGIERASLRIQQKSAGWWRKGYYVEGTELLYSVYYGDPLFIVFEMPSKNYNEKLLDKPTYHRKKDKDSIWFQLDLEKIHFFSLGKDEQLEEITKFVNTAYAEAQQMRIKK